MRKHVATFAQIEEISDTMQDQLAQFPRHDIRVHREFYRLPFGLLQKAKIGKFLFMASEGQQTSLEEINIEPEDMLNSV